MAKYINSFIHKHIFCFYCYLIFLAFCENVVVHSHTHICLFIYLYSFAFFETAIVVRTCFCSLFLLTAAVWVSDRANEQANISRHYLARMCQLPTTQTPTHRHIHYTHSLAITHTEQKGTIIKTNKSDK